MTSLPTLVVVSGPPGSGKTTLARQLARAVGCPAICQDGWPCSASCTAPWALSWPSGAHCGAGREIPLRRAHADPGPKDAADQALVHSSFERVSVDAPWIEVDTTNGYRPGLGEIVAFVNGPGSVAGSERT